MSNDNNKQQNQQNQQKQKGGGGNVPANGIAMHGSHSGGNKGAVRTAFADAVGYFFSALFAAGAAIVFDKANNALFGRKQHAQPQQQAPKQNGTVDQDDSEPASEFDVPEIVSEALKNFENPSAADKGKIMAAIMGEYRDKGIDGKAVAAEVDAQLAG